MSLKWLALCLMAGGLAGIGGAYLLDFETLVPVRYDSRLRRHARPWDRTES
jgi:hypothetical protein